MSEVIVINRDGAMRLLREVVAEHGEGKVYEKIRGECLYERDGCPDCIVGHVLARAGASVEQLAYLDGLGVISQINVPWLSLTGWARRTLAAAQAAQDVGHTWGYALARAADKW